MPLTPGLFQFFKGKEPAWEVPRLKVVDDMVEVTRKANIDFSRTVVFGNQHHLETTETLDLGLKELGIKRIYSIGKCYSTSEIVEKSMIENGIRVIPCPKPKEPGGFYEAFRFGVENGWRTLLDEIKDEDVETIIILGDGGRVLELMPAYARLKYKVAGVEQTRGGLYSQELDKLPFAVVEVASSAAKRMLEPPLIASAVIDSIKEILPSLELNTHTVFGVIGNGVIGNAIARYLLSQGLSVAVYDSNDTAFSGMDKENSKFFRMPDVQSLLANSNYVFSCTGRDVTEGIAEKLLKDTVNNVVLLSASSEDREFKELIQAIVRRQRNVPRDPLADIKCYTDAGGTISIVGAGYPVNFLVNSRFGLTWNVPAQDIAVTQGLLFGAVVQAQLMARRPIADGVTINRALRLKLDENIQNFVVYSWDETEHGCSYPPQLMKKFKEDLGWIRLNSGGTYVENMLLKQIFSHSNTPILRSKL